MSVEDRLLELAERVRRMSVEGYSERSTERYLVEPFIDALGYDSRDPAEVQPQLPIQIGSTTGLCDYAIILKNEVRVLVECKRVGVNLDTQGQLSSYFSQVPTALLGIYTNGTEYRFYAEQNYGRVKRMDSAPFLILRLDNIDQPDVRTAAKCGKEQLTDGDAFLHWVTSLRHVRTIEDRLRRELTGQPSDELVALAMGWAGIQERTPERVEEFRGILRDAASGLLNPMPAEPILPLVPPIQPKQSSPSLEPQTIPQGMVSLSSVIEATGKPSPTEVMLPGATPKPIRYWKYILVETARWLIDQGKLTAADCPIRAFEGKGAIRYLFHTEKAHYPGNAFKRPVDLGQSGIYLETDYEPNVLIACTKRALERFDVDPSTVYVRLP